MGLALVDIDGTLLGGLSCEQRFVVDLIRGRRIGLAQMVEAVRFTARELPNHGRHVFKKNKAYLAGLEVSEIEALADAFVARAIVPRLRPAILQRIERHLRQREPVLLLTGAPEFLARPLARAVGAERWRATVCARARGRFLAAAPCAHPFAEEKLAHARELCAGYGVALDSCTAYADSIHDLALLRAVGSPVAVHPDAALRHLARHAGWEILLPGGEQQRRHGTIRRLVAAAAAPRGSRSR